nr:hypothetical protein [Tanacetum cinerariifolium]
MSPSHRSYGAPMRPSHGPAGHRPHGPPMRPMRSNINGARPKRTSVVRPQNRAPWVPTVNRNFPLLIENFPLAVINERNRVKDVQASACWVWKSVKPNSASIILKRYDYVDVRGRSRNLIADAASSLEEDCWELNVRSIPTSSAFFPLPVMCSHCQKKFPLLEESSHCQKKFPHRLLSVLIILKGPVLEFSTSGYNAVPPPAADLYRSPKKDLSWTGLPEFVDDTVTDYSRPSPTVESTSAEGQNKNSTIAENGESTDSILSKPAVKFVKAGDRPTERPSTNKAEFVKAAERPTTDKVETAKKPAVRYAEMYRRTSKRSYGAPMRPSHGPAGHRPHGPPIRPMRSNMNGARPKRTSAEFPFVNRKLPTGNSNVSTVCCCCSRHVNTARPKAVIKWRNKVKDVQASACWVWKSIKPNSASIILKRYDYIDVRGRSSDVFPLPEEVPTARRKFLLPKEVPTGSAK